MPTLSDLSSPDFWKQAAENAVVTGAASLAAQLAVFHTEEIQKLGLTGLPWDDMGSVAVVAALLAVLTAVGKQKAPKVRCLISRKKAVVVEEAPAPVVPVEEPKDTAEDGATQSKSKKGAKAPDSKG